MKVLVTGANGYLGSGVVRRLLDDGIDVIATDFSGDNIDDRANMVIGDLFGSDDPYLYFGKPDVLLHMAWRNGFVHNDISHLTDFEKHALFIKKMCESPIKQIAVMGTMHEIGFFEGSIKEDTATHPESLYGISKDALRNVTSLFCEQNNVIFQWLRGFYIVGNTEHGSSVFSKITSAEKKGNTFFPFTMGQNQWDFIDYNEFCAQTAMVVEQSEVNGIINICSGYPQKLADRVEQFLKDNNYSIKLEYGKFPDRPYDSKAVWGDDTKINLIRLKQRDK